MQSLIVSKPSSFKIRLLVLVSVMLLLIIILMYNDSLSGSGVNLSSNNFGLTQHDSLTGIYDFPLIDPSLSLDIRQREFVDITNFKQAEVTPIYSNKVQVIKTFSLEDQALLAHLIESEAGNEPYLAKIGVGNVVVNRMQMMSQTLQEVLYSPNQFDGVHTLNFVTEPSYDSTKASKEVLSGRKLLNSAFYFGNLNLCSPNWAISDKLLVRIGDTWFFSR